MDRENSIVSDNQSTNNESTSPMQMIQIQPIPVKVEFSSDQSLSKHEDNNNDHSGTEWKFFVYEDLVCF